MVKRLAVVVAGAAAGVLLWYVVAWARSAPADDGSVSVYDCEYVIGVESDCV